MFLFTILRFILLVSVASIIEFRSIFSGLLNKIILSNLIHCLEIRIGAVPLESNTNQYGDQYVKQMYLDFQNCMSLLDKVARDLKASLI